MSIEGLTNIDVASARILSQEAASLSVGLESPLGISGIGPEPDLSSNLTTLYYYSDINKVVKYEPAVVSAPSIPRGPSIAGAGPVEPVTDFWPYKVIQYPLYVGETWLAINASVVSGPVTTTMVGTASVVAYDELIVQGVNYDAFRIDSNYLTFTSGVTDPVESSYADWYVSGVGLVRRIDLNKMATTELFDFVPAP